MAIEMQCCPVCGNFIHWSEIAPTSQHQRTQPRFTCCSMPTCIRAAAEKRKPPLRMH